MVVKKYWPAYSNFSLDFYKLNYIYSVIVSVMKGGVLKAFCPYWCQINFYLCCRRFLLIS